MPPIVALYVLLLASGAIGPLRMLTVHQLAVAVGAGFDRLMAAAVIGLSGTVTAVAFVGFGHLSDRIGRRQAYRIGSCCLIAAIAILARLNNAEQAQWLLVYALLLGLGEGAPRKTLRAIERAMGAFAAAIGVAVIDELTLVDRFYDIAQRMVYHPVTERGGADLALLGIVDEETAIRARLVGLVMQLTLQLQQLTFSIELESGDAELAALALARFTPCEIKVAKGSDLRIEILVCLHLLSFYSNFSRSLRLWAQRIWGHAWRR